METITVTASLAPGTKITVYFKGRFGVKGIEGKFVRLEDRTAENYVCANSVSVNVVIIRKGARKEEHICLPFWVIALGWNLPKIPGLAPSLPDYESGDARTVLCYDVDTALMDSVKSVASFRNKTLTLS